MGGTKLIFVIQKEQQKTYGLGTIKFSLSYDFGSQTLLVKIVKADNIPAMDIGGTSDPFVKVSKTPTYLRLNVGIIFCVGVPASR